MKKLLFIISFLLVFTTACSGSSKTSEDSTQGDNGDVVELTLSSWRVEEIEAYKKINEKFNEEYPHIKIKYDTITATEYDSALNTALETGSGPDLFYVRPFDRGADLYEANHLLELDESKLPNLANINETQKAVYQQEDGTLYAAPYVYIAFGYLYNKAIFEEHNLEEPKTWDEFYSLLDTLVEKDIIPIALGTGDPWVLTEAVSFGNYGNFVGGEDWRQQLIQGEAKVTDENFVEFLDNLQSLSRYLPDNYNGIGYAESQQMFTIEQAAIYPTGSFDIGPLQTMNPDLEMGFFPSPVVNESDKAWVGFNGGAGLGVNPNSEHIDEALTYINWLLSEEAQIMVGNEMVGLFPSANIDNDLLEDPLVKEWIASGGEDGENFAIGWALQKVSAESPGAYELASDLLPQLLLNDITPKETANKIQEGLDQWFKP